MAILPVFGLSNGRLTVGYNANHAVSSMSARKARFKFVRLIRAGEVGLADEESLVVVVRVKEPAGNFVQVSVANFTGHGSANETRCMLLLLLLPGRLNAPPAIAKPHSGL